MRGKSIIVVENDASVCALIRYALEAEGYAVQTFLDPQAGLLAARAAPPSAFIINLLSVHAINAGVCRALRENPRTAKVPIIVCTGRGNDTVNRSLGKPAAGDLSPRVVFKPFKLPELLRCVRQAVLDGSSPP
jgi:two-component system phosphate regulon response regulator PhoB